MSTDIRRRKFRVVRRVSVLDNQVGTGTRQSRIEKEEQDYDRDLLAAKKAAQDYITAYERATGKKLPLGSYSKFIDMMMRQIPQPIRESRPRAGRAYTIAKQAMMALIASGANKRGYAIWKKQWKGFLAEGGTQYLFALLVEKNARWHEYPMVRRFFAELWRVPPEEKKTE